MADGRRHETVNLLVLGGLTAAWFYNRSLGRQLLPDELFPLPARISFVVAYLVGTFLVTPDLDLANRSVRAKKHWGLLGFLWVPYGVMFRHRGLSHSWWLGPLTRLLYMLVLLLALLEFSQVLAGWLGYALEFRADLYGDWGWLLAGSVVGYYLSQWMHLLLDGLLLKRR